MVSVPSGMRREVRPVQLLNAFAGIVVREEGSVSSVMLTQEPKAPSASWVEPSSMVNLIWCLPSFRSLDISLTMPTVPRMTISSSTGLLVYRE